MTAKPPLVILAGGKGSRLAAETPGLPDMRKHKALATVGGIALIDHILAWHARFGVTEAIIALGHHARSVQRHMLDRLMIAPDMTLDGRTGQVTRHAPPGFAGSVRLVETGLETGSAGRLMKLHPLLSGTVIVTFCDGLYDIDIAAFLAFHRATGRAATMAVIRPASRFGLVARDAADPSRVTAFHEKPVDPERAVNAGLFAFEPRALDAIASEGEMLETGLLPRLAQAGDLTAFDHHGFWDCVDTPKDRARLEALWASGNAPFRAPFRAAEG